MIFIIFGLCANTPFVKWVSGRRLTLAYEDSDVLPNNRDITSNHQSHDCLPNRLSRRRSKKIPKLRVTGLCVGNSPVTGEFPAQRASNAENVSILPLISKDALWSAHSLLEPGWRQRNLVENIPIFVVNNVPATDQALGWPSQYLVNGRVGHLKA